MLANKIFLVTGGAGFIGSHLIDELIDSGNHIICIDDLSTGKEENLKKNDNIDFIRKNLNDVNLYKLDNNISGIFHLAAQTSVPISINDFYMSSKNNLIGMLKILDFARKNSIPFVYASSSAIYGNQHLGNDEINDFNILSPYALDKLTMEYYSKMCFDIYKNSSFGLRFFNVYGPRQDPSSPYSGVISIFIDKLLKKEAVTVNGGYQTRDFIYVKDIVSVITKSMEHIINNQICNYLNVGTGLSVTINDLLSSISNILDFKPKIINKSLPIGDPEKSEGTYSKLKNELKIDVSKFVSLEDGLNSTINYIKQKQNL